MVLYCGTGSGNTPSPGDPSNPSQLVATPVFEGIRISWDFPTVNPETVAHFIVYRSTTNIYDDADTFKITSSDSITDFLDVSLPTTYFYWVAVRAVNGYIGEIQGPAWATAQPTKVSILNALNADINASKLALDLQASIGKIDILEDTILLNETNRDTDVTTLTNLIAQVNEDSEYSASLWQEEITTRASDYNALSQSIVTQQTTLGDNTASIEILSAVTDGISGQYYVKIDNNGAMTGFGLSSEAVYDANGNVNGALSQFIVDANRFVIRDANSYDPATNPNSVNPFIVDNGITYINEAVIKSIQSTDFANNPGSQFTGWKIDRSGSIEAAAITIYASDGTTILQAGDPSDAIANSAQAWSDIGGTGKPANDATRNFFRGLYLTTTDYVVGDMVTYESEVYICILEHLATTANTTPSGDGTANTYWDIFSKKGDPGISISSTESVDGVTTVTFSDGSTIVINDGADGAVSNARSVSLSAPTQAIAYDSEGNTPSPSANFVVTATSVNTEGTAKYTFKVNGIEAQAKSTLATYTYTPPTTYAGLPDVITVELTEDSDTEILDTDTYTIFGVKPGVTGETGDNPFTKTDLTAQYKPFTAGSGAIDFWNTSENTNDGADVREIDIDAFGGKSVIWKAINGHTHGTTLPLDLTDNDADGGFNSAKFYIDHTKLYRYSIFIKQDTHLDGGKYWGTHGYGSPGINDCIIEIAPNTATDSTSNPYFWTGATLPTNDEWYLIVGYVFPSDTVGTPHLTTEMYHVASGQKVAGVTGFRTFKWLDTALESNCRAYQYYNERDVADEVWFWQPRVDAMVDDTPSIQDILRKGFKGEVGTSGLNGASVNIIFQRAAIAPSTPETSSSIPNDWADSPSNSAGFLWASKGTTAVDSNDYVWETPYQVDGSVFAEITIFKKAATATTPNTGSYNFTNSTLTAPSGWNTSIPAISANNEIIYASVGLFSGASTDSTVTTTWSSPVIYAQRTDGTDGAPGSAGNPGDNALTIVLSNEVHTVPANAAGSVDSSDYLGSGTIIRVYDGAEQLDYDAVGTTTGHYTIVAAATGITINAISQAGPRAAMVADFSAMTADVATVEYTITGKNLSGVAFETTKTQTITKSKAGVQGNPGSSVSIANTSTSNGVTTITFNDSNGSIDISDGSDGSSAQIAIAYASSKDGAERSFTAADNLNFVKYHEYTGTAPPLGDDVFDSGFVRYIGEDGNTPTNSGIQTFFAEDPNGLNKSVTFVAGLEYVNLYEWTETRIANDADIPSGLTYVKFSGTDGTTPQLGVDYFNAVDPSIFTWRGLNTWPIQTTYAGGDKYTFESTDSGKCLIKVEAKDAEGDIHVGLNGVDLGTMNGLDNATQMYSFTATNLIAGSNEISIWSTSIDGGQVKEIHVFHIAADGINGTSIKLQYSANGSTNWHDAFAVGDLYVRSGTKAGNAASYTYGAATKFVPEKGVEYDDGDDGTNAYLHLAYGTSATGLNFSQDPADATYIGSYTDNQQDDSTNPANYTWAKIKGEDGTDGTSAGVKVVYASNESGDEKNFTQGNLKFVKYHEYTGSVPSLNDIPSNGFVRFIGVDGTTPTNSGVKPVYSVDGTFSTDLGNLSFVPLGHTYVTFYEWTGSAPIVINDLDLTGAVFVKFEGTDGEDGVDGLKGGGLDLNFIDAEMDATGAVNKISTSTSWNSSVYSTNSYEGGCYLTFKTLTTDVAYMVALNETSDVTNSGYATLDFAWNIRSQGNLSTYESGDYISLVPSIPYYNVNDVFSITYDNDKVRYLHNGVVMRTVEVGPGKKFHFDSSIGYKNTTQVSAANIKVFTDVHFAPSGNAGVDGTSALIPNLLPARLTDAIADDNFDNYEISYGVLPTDNIDTWDVTLVTEGYGYDSNGDPINYWVPPSSTEAKVISGEDEPSTDLSISPTDFQGGSGGVLEFVVNYNNDPQTPGTWKALSGANRATSSPIDDSYPQGGPDQNFEVAMTFVPGVKSRLVFEKVVDNSVVPPMPSEAWLLGKRFTGQTQAFFGEVDQLDILFDSKKEYLLSFDVWESNGGSSATEVYGNKFDTRGSKLRFNLHAGLDPSVDNASYPSGADKWESTSASNGSGVWNRVTLGPYSWSADYPRSTRGRIRVIVPNPTVASYQIDASDHWMQRIVIKNLSLTELNINSSYDAAGNLYPVEYRPPLALKLTAANKQTYISNLSVDTLQIANQAVVVPTLVTMPQVTLTRGALTTYSSIDYLFNGGGWLMDFILPVTGAPVSFFLSRTLTEGVSEIFTDIRGTQASGGLNLGMSVSYEHPVAPTINNYLGKMEGYVNLDNYSPYRISREHFGESTKLFNFTPDVNQWRSLENSHLYADEIRIKVGLFGTNRRVNAGFEFNITLNALCLETKK